MSSPFISRQDLSDYIGRDVSADDGATIAVDAACQMVRTLAEQTLYPSGTATEYVDGSGTDVLILRERPVGTISEVLVAGTAETDYRFTAEGHLTRGTGYENRDLAAAWPPGRQNVRVTYSYGYSEVPEDLRFVALSLASRMVVQGGAINERVGEDAITYAVASTDVTDGERAIIHKYRRLGA